MEIDFKQNKSLKENFDILSDKNFWSPNGPARRAFRSPGRFIGRLGRPIILHTATQPTTMGSPLGESGFCIFCSTDVASRGLQNFFYNDFELNVQELCLQAQFFKGLDSVMHPNNLNSLRPRQNGRHFADDTFKCFFLKENVRISIKISLKFVPKGPFNNNSSLVQIMAWRRPGDKPLSEPMMVRSLTHICVIRPQWVNSLWPRDTRNISHSTVISLCPHPFFPPPYRDHFVYTPRQWDVTNNVVPHWFSTCTEWSPILAPRQIIKKLPITTTSAFST